MSITIEILEEEYPVYDLTVEDNNNFYANDILVHNCSEIVQYTDSDTTAICVLSSMILKNFVQTNNNKTIFNYQLLHNEVRQVVKALNKLIDINKYSTHRGKKGASEQRAIGIGVQGLSDVFFLLDLIFDSDEAKDVNKKIFETIYHAALTESNSLVKNKIQEKYMYFDGSPLSEGKFQFDLWGEGTYELSGMWDWETLRNDIVKYGVCNSLVTTQMPVAGSAKLTGSNEMTQAPTSNIGNRRVLGGEYIILNNYMVNDFAKLGIWGEALKNEIIMNNGSIQEINFNRFLDIEDSKYEKKVQRIEYLIKKYRTVWEIPQKEVINMAADRGPFIDQSQSLNIFMANPDISKISAAMFYGWNKGLKTLSYYLRTKAISTGAKHLAMDVSEMNRKALNNEEDVKFVDEAIRPHNEVILGPTLGINPPIPIGIAEENPFECVGCSA